MEYLSLPSIADGLIETTLSPNQHSTSRELKLTVENDELGLSRVRITDVEFPRVFSMQIFTEKVEGMRFISFAYKTRVHQSKLLDYGFLTESGHHPDLFAGRFVNDMLNLAEENAFGPIAGIRERWYEIKGKTDNFDQYMLARRHPHDLQAAMQTWDYAAFEAFDYVPVRVDEFEDPFEKRIDSVIAYFQKI